MGRYARAASHHARGVTKPRHKVTLTKRRVTPDGHTSECHIESHTPRHKVTLTKHRVTPDGHIRVSHRVTRTASQIDTNSENAASHEIVTRQTAKSSHNTTSQSDTHKTPRHTRSHVNVTSSQHRVSMWHSQNAASHNIFTSKCLNMSHHRVTKCHERARHNGDRHQKVALRHITYACARTTRTRVVAAPPPPPPPPPRTTTGAAQRRETRECPTTWRETHSARHNQPPRTPHHTCITTSMDGRCQRSIRRVHGAKAHIADKCQNVVPQ
jgi:hypothetical protein